MVINPPMANFADVQAVQDEAELNQTSVQNVLRNMTQQLPQFNIDGLLEGNLGEINLADIEQVNKATTDYLRANVYPDIAKAVVDQIPQFFQDNARQFLDSLGREDFDQLALAMGIEPTQLFDAMAQYFGSNN